jgi:phosphate/sulfate permease
MRRTAKAVCVVSALKSFGFTLAGTALAEKIQVGVVYPLIAKPDVGRSSIEKLIPLIKWLWWAAVAVKIEEPRSKLRGISQI